MRGEMQGMSSTIRFARKGQGKGRSCLGGGGREGWGPWGELPAARGAGQPQHPALEGEAVPPAHPVVCQRGLRDLQRLLGAAQVASHVQGQPEPPLPPPPWAAQPPCRPHTPVCPRISSQGFQHSENPRRNESAPDSLHGISRAKSAGRSVRGKEEVKQRWERGNSVPRSRSLGERGLNQVDEAGEGACEHTIVPSITTRSLTACQGGWEAEGSRSSFYGGGRRRGEQGRTE